MQETLHRAAGWIKASPNLGELKLDLGSRDADSAMDVAHVIPEYSLIGVPEFCARDSNVLRTLRHLTTLTLNLARTEMDTESLLFMIGCIQSVRVLNLDIADVFLDTDDRLLGDDILARIIEGLPQGLTQLTLDVSSTNITALERNLPAGLASLDLRLCECHHGLDVAKILLAMPSNLKRCQISCAGSHFKPAPSWDDDLIEVLRVQHDPIEVLRVQHDPARLKYLLKGVENGVVRNAWKAVLEDASEEYNYYQPCPKPHDQDYYSDDYSDDGDGDDYSYDGG